MKTLGEKIKELRLARKETQQQLAVAAHTTRSAVNQWESGKTKQMNGEYLARIAHHYNVNALWLSTGEGKQYPYPENTTFEPTATPYDIKNKLIPLISSVSAGKWCDVINYYSRDDAEEWLSCPKSCSQYTYVLRVDGDSMTAPFGKSYPHGSYIYVDPEAPITNLCRVVAKLPHVEQAIFKQYVEDSGKRYLKALNPQYPMIEITDDTRICGVVIGKYEPE